ncbi:hypothetical protein F3Y22_tig00002237pilonHSYRG00704 [Hibiscus syriacus]|uniref:Uncharacterized protein n=1 Tax=Hibiscus syriacus TaxID=106335 RepID=A0A6A3CRL6_HIBSY|nr:hypothetical protein F3Y22_tig00002237pilonHSYRG00704 [Hibiscus syriacus]
MKFSSLCAASTFISPPLLSKGLQINEFETFIFIYLSSSPFSKLRSHHFASPPLQRFSTIPNYKTGFKNQIRAIQEATADTITSQKRKEDDEQKSQQNWKIKMFYEGDCPLCMREVDMLRERNKQYGTIKFVDISSDDYSPEENQRSDYKTVMRIIHAILFDGTVVTDVEQTRVARLSPRHFRPRHDHGRSKQAAMTAHSRAKLTGFERTRLQVDDSRNAVKGDDRRAYLTGQMA